MSTPSPQRTWLLLAVIALLAAAAFFWWRASRPTPPPASPATPPTTQAQSGRATPTDLARALAVPEPRERARAFGTAFESWLNRDLESALAYLRTLPPGAEFTQGLLALLPRVAATDPDRALRLAAELATTAETRAVYHLLFDRFAREDLNSALSRLAAVTPGPARENALRAVADVFVRGNVDAALAWARNLPDSTERMVALESVLHEVAARDPLLAVDVSEKHLSGDALHRILGLSVKRLAETTPVDAATLVARLPAGDTQTIAAATVARALGEREVRAGLAWLDALPTGRTREIALQNLLTSWTPRDPTAAARHVARLEPGPLRDAALPHVASLLAQQNGPSAAAWVGALPSAPARDQALVMVASAWAQREPAAASDWSVTLPAGPLREAAVAAAHSYWQLQDAIAARAWLERAPVSDSLKSRLRGAR